MMTIKLKDHKRIVRDYQPYFPGWKIVTGDTLGRENGPIFQGILFDRASRDVYKPTGYIVILTGPSPGQGLELFQRLRYPNGAPDRSVSLTRHEKEKEKTVDEIVKALRSQILPPVEQPLNVMEVLELYEREAVPTSSEAYSLATLRAYLGYAAEARAWRQRFQECLLEETSAPIDEIRAEFLRTLEDWLEKGEARERLEAVIQEQRLEIGIA